jgi:CheY-like chemotaxis protein
MSSRTVLVVEDTELLRRIYCDKLTQDGYLVFSATNGLEALNILRTESVDLVLLDLIMPTMSGIEALDAMKADPRTKNIPVLILSNLGQEGDVRRGLALGAIDYLIKNEAKPADVARRIGEVLDELSAHKAEDHTYRLRLRDNEADADRFVQEAGLTRRFWCPTCEVELELELLAKPSDPGWYDAHLVCPSCGKDF